MRKNAFWIACLLLLLPLIASAQSDAAPELVPGVDATGTLDSTNFVDTYIFAGSAGDSITLDAVTASETLNLVLLLASPSGAIVAEDSDLTPVGEAVIGDFSLPEDGQYLVSIMRGTGASGDESGTYNLTLSGTLTPPATPSAPVAEATAAPPPTTTATTANLTEGGIEINLSWSGAVNMNLEVRDPQGGAIFTGSGDSPSGGSLAEDVNADCETATADNPSETIAWQPGIVPAGSYEIILYYVDGCTQGGPQQFTVTAGVNGEEPESIASTLLPNQKYVTAVEIAEDGSWDLLVGGVNVALDVSLLSTQIANALPLPGTTVTGTINRAQPAVAYTFEGVAGDTVNLTMDATSGSLDPFLILLDPAGVQVASNDDRAAGNTNSTISQTLNQNGIYTIVATRYGQVIGGTEGNFTVNLSLDVTGTAAATPEPATSTEATSEPLDLDTAESTDSVTPVDPLAAGSGTGSIPETLPNGSVEIYLTWNTTADIQLLVRDPAGTAIFDDNTSSQSGGILDQAGNARCAGNAAPVSYIYWPQSLLPRGSYELDIWYQDNCGDTNPVTFSLIINVQGEEIVNTQQPATPDSHYGITFDVDQDGNATAGLGGFFDMEDATSIDYFSRLADAEPIEFGDTVPGEITSVDRVQLYSFEGTTGDRVRITMQRTGGTLDTALFLISPEGIQLANNDDIVDPVTGERDTNSLIDGVTLTSTGTYYIIATHYGLLYGGTTGTYNLTLFQLAP